MQGFAPTVTTVAAAAGTFGETTTLQATLTASGADLAGETVTFTLNGVPVGSAMTDGSGVATLSAVSLAGIGGGTHVGYVGASFLGDTGYAGSSDTAALTVGRASQSIAFGALAGKTYGDAAFTLVASASSGLGVTFTIDAGPATLSGNTLTINGAGTVFVRASQAGDTDYDAAPDVVQSFTVARAQLTVTADDQGRTYGDSNPTLTATITGFTNGDTASVLTGAPGLSTTADADSPLGRYTITVTAGTLAAANYDIATVDGTLTVTRASLIIVAADQTKCYGDPNPPLTGTLIGIKNGDPISGAYLSSADTSSAVGSYGIRAAVVDGSPDHRLGNYDVTLIGGTLRILPAPLVVVADGAAKVYGAPNPTLTGNLIGLKNGDGITATYQTTATATSHAGLYPIVPAVTGPDGALSNYAVTTIGATLAVTPATLTITASDQSMTYGGAPPALTASYAGFVNGDTPASLTTAPTLSTAAANSPAGRYAITAGGAASDDYSILYVNGTLTVAKASLTIAADDQTAVYGRPIPALSATYAGFVPGQDASVLNGTLSFATTAATGSHAGQYAITPGGLTAENYAIAFVSGTLTITPAPLVITANDVAKVSGQPNPPLTASYAGFVNGDTPASLTTAPTLSTTAGVDSAPGQYAITASGAADPDYTITYSGGTFTVTASPAADLSVRMGATPNPVKAGSVLTYTLTITNHGPELATGVTLVDALPAGAAFLKATSSRGTVAMASGVVVANLGALDVGATVTVSITVQPTAAGVLTNSVLVHSDQADPHPADNTSAQATLVNPSAPTAPVQVPTSGDTSQPTGDTTPPTVVALRSTKIRTSRRGRRQNAIVLTFSEPMAPAPAGAAGNYRLVSAGRDRRFGTRDDRTLSLGSAAYDPATKLVTLTVSGRSPRNQPMEVIALSPALVDLAHNALDGDFNGQPGGNYVGRFGPRPRS